jgi:hypothetical protein
MASANEPGLIEVRVSRQGKGEHALLTARSDSNINAGKSPDGVLANLTVDKQLYIPQNPTPILAGDKIVVYFKPDSADGLDVSDGVYYLPFYENGSFRPLNATDLGITTDLPAGTLAGNWVALGAGYTVPNSVRQANFGGGSIVISVEDDT